MPLRLLLHEVGVTSDCVDVVFTGYDAGMEHGEFRYFQHSLEIHDPVIDHSMVCWMHNGVEVTRSHSDTDSHLPSPSPQPSVCINLSVTA